MKNPEMFRLRAVGAVVFFLGCQGGADLSADTDSEHLLLCSAAEDLAREQRSSVGSRQDSLYGDKSRMWHPIGTPPLVHVCYETSVPTTGTKRADIRNHAETWQRYARINFTEWDNCTSGEAGLHVELHSGGGSNAGGGYTTLNGTNNGIRLDSADDNPTGSPAGTRFRNVTIHEFGHAIGYFHEEERLDYTPSGDRNGNGTLDTSVGENVITKCGTQTSAVTNNSPSYYGSYDVKSVMSYCGGYCWDAACNNTPSELSPNDIASAQTAYGRRLPGQLVSPQGDCAASPANDSDRNVFLWDCDEYEDDQEFVFTRSTGTLHIRSGIVARPTWCMESTTSGTTANVETYQACDGFAGQQWRFDSVYLRGWGGLCLDLENGNTSGGRAQLYQCGAAGGVNQKWTITTAGAIKFGGNSSTKCLAENGAGGLVVTTCNGTSAQQFTYAGDGTIKRVSSGLCIDAQAPWTSTYSPTDAGFGSGLPANQIVVNEYTCTANQLNQKWNTSGPVLHVSTGTCLERTSGAFSNGTNIQRATCSGSAAQLWEYYF